MEGLKECCNRIFDCCGLCEKQGSAEERRLLLSEPPPRQSMSESISNFLGLENANTRNATTAPGKERRGKPGIDYTPAIANQHVGITADQKVEELDLKQCSIFFNKKYWSSRYPAEYFHSEVTSVRNEDGKFRLRVMNSCLTYVWTVDHTLKDYRTFLDEIKKAHQMNEESGSFFPTVTLPSYEHISAAKAAELLEHLQKFHHDLMSLNDICQNPLLRQFFDLDHQFELARNVAHNLVPAEEMSPRSAARKLESAKIGGGPVLGADSEDEKLAAEGGEDVGKNDEDDDDDDDDDEEEDEKEENGEGNKGGSRQGESVGVATQVAKQEAVEEGEAEEESGEESDEESDEDGDEESDEESDEDGDEESEEEEERVAA
eukprot:g3185.t1